MRGHLEADGLSKHFAGLVAVDELSLVVRPGEIVGLIGPNGAGKTTFFNCVTGLEPPTAGRVRLDGVDVTGWSPAARARHGLARTFQQVRLFGHLSVRENLLLGRHQHYGAGALQAALRTPRARAAERDAAAHVEAVAERCNLASVLDAPVGDLPHGTQRMVEVARALATEPAVLLLDEPAAGMDTTESAAFGELLRRVHDPSQSEQPPSREAWSVLLVEHDVPLVLSVCDRIYVLEFGRLIAAGTPAEIRSDERVRAAYFGASVA
ncbi:MAG TPA: ABC transporter ATP-binding protein [Acidimicrobiia bacterium]|nr:ABC transporter ATP-binding protein [Acidimicrobiia bacterium]